MNVSNMGRNKYFQFKEFKIIQEQAAMKVGTDGVMLGAWVNTGSAKQILDVGTGTGLIALMMAQRTNASITGIEIESKAAEEALTNSKNSPWHNRISIVNASLQSFAQAEPEKFDLIISNPPFFSNSQKSKCEMLAMAKHNHMLPPADLIDCSVRLLNPGGRLAIILPCDSVTVIKQLAAKAQLHLLRETEVKPNSIKKPHRLLMEFGKTAHQPVEKDSVLIHNDDGYGFTNQYKSLTQMFYLNF